MRTIQNLINNLSQAGIDKPRYTVSVLLAHILEQDQNKLYFELDNCPLSAEQEKVLKSYINRVIEGEPLSKIIHNREFYGFDFYLNEHVLDPRPDTECLIDLTQELLPNFDAPYKFLDLGTGSGCLIITLLNLYINAEGSAVDLSEKALQVTRTNREKHHLESRLDLHHGSWYSPLESIPPCPIFDLIISNPPYIEKGDPRVNETASKYDPDLALYADHMGLKAYKDIFEKASTFLKNEGFIIVEIGQNQESDVCNIAFQNGFQLKQTKKDLSGIIRGLCFQKNSK